MLWWKYFLQNYSSRINRVAEKVNQKAPKHFSELAALTDLTVWLTYPSGVPPLRPSLTASMQATSVELTSGHLLRMLPTTAKLSILTTVWFFALRPSKISWRQKTHKLLLNKLQIGITTLYDTNASMRLTVRKFPYNNGARPAKWVARLFTVSLQALDGFSFTVEP